MTLDRDFLEAFTGFDDQRGADMGAHQNNGLRLNVRQVKDVLERAVATYVQAVVGLVIAAGATSLDMGTLRAAAVGAVPAALSVIKGWLAAVLPVGDDSASMLP